MTGVQTCALPILNDAYLLRNRIGPDAPGISIYSFDSDHYSVTIFYAYVAALIPNVTFGLTRSRPTADSNPIANEHDVGPRRCLDWLSLQCYFRLGPLPGDYIVAFGSEDTIAAVRQKYGLLYESTPIGFWQNTTRAYVFLAID